MRIKADKYLKETLTEILENGTIDENPRPKWSDGTPAYSKFITQKIFNFNITRGEFPITTLRNGSLKVAFQELKTIYIDQSNKEEDFIKNGVNWWGSWMNDKGDLGTAYSYNLESLPKNSDVLTKIAKKEIEIEEPILPPDFTHVFTETKHKNANKIVSSKYVDYRILDKVGSYKKNIQLLDCGLITEIGTNKNVISPFSKTIGNLFYLGFYKNFNFEKDTLERLLDIWRNMADRITGKGLNNAKYGEENVSKKWLSFQGFLEDIPHVPQFFLAKKDNFIDWTLDKDYYGSKYYSKNTCAFLKKSDNSKYTERQKIYSVGKNYFDSTKKLAEYLGVTDKSVRYILEEESHNINRVRKEKTLNLKEQFQVVVDEENVYRRPLSKNQIVELLKNLEVDKFSRRHILSLFNWGEQDNKQLMECAFENLFSVRVINGVNYLDQTLIQRSSDFIVAGMINCAQYVMLNMIICNHLKYKTAENWVVGNFSWVVQNLHVYDRHEWAIKELLDKEVTKLQPKMELICKPKDFFQHTWEDFKITGTEGITPLSKKLEIAV